VRCRGRARRTALARRHHRALAGARPGLWLALALLPVEFVFWIGFALPFGPIVGVARTVLVDIALTERT